MKRLDLTCGRVHYYIVFDMELGELDGSAVKR